MMTCDYLCDASSDATAEGRDANVWVHKVRRIADRLQVVHLIQSAEKGHHDE